MNSVVEWTCVRRAEFIEAFVAGRIETTGKYKRSCCMVVSIRLRLSPQATQPPKYDYGN